MQENAGMSALVATSASVALALDSPGDDDVEEIVANNTFNFNISNGQLPPHLTSLHSRHCSKLLIPLCLYIHCCVVCLNF